jgi:hypothetical protein
MILSEMSITFPHGMFVVKRRASELSANERRDIPRWLSEPVI